MEDLTITIRFCATVAALTFAASSAFGQAAFPRNAMIPEGYVAVQSSISLSLPFDQSVQADE